MSLSTFLTGCAQSAVRAQEALDAAWCESWSAHAAAGRGTDPRLGGLWLSLAPPRPVIAEMETALEVELRSTREREAGAGIGLAVIPLGISVFARHRHETMRTASLRITVARAEPADERLDEPLDEPLDGGPKR